MEPDDDESLARYRAGDAAALEALVEKHRRPLYAFILNRAAGTADADEIFQETWLRAIRKIHQFRAGNLRGWLVRIARNIVIDRSRRRRPEVSLDGAPAGEPSWHEMAPDPGPTPAEAATGADIRRRVAEAVAGLPAPQREVFLMRVEAGLAFKEIARAQGVSINTALARMQYALTKLRPLVGAEGEGVRHADV